MSRPTLRSGPPPSLPGGERPGRRLGRTRLRARVRVCELAARFVCDCAGSPLDDERARVSVPRLAQEACSTPRAG